MLHFLTSLKLSLHNKGDIQADCLVIPMGIYYSIWKQVFFGLFSWSNGDVIKQLHLITELYKD